MKLNLEEIRARCEEASKAEINKLKQSLAEADSILLGISDPTWSDERLSYVEVQMSREDYKALQEYLQKRGKNG